MALGGVRLPNSGKGQPDAPCPGFAVQVTTTTALPKRLVEAVDQAARDAGGGEVPIVVRNQVSQGRRARRLAVLQLEAWRALIAEESGVQG